MLEPVHDESTTTEVAVYTPAQQQFVAGQLAGETKRAYAADLRHFIRWLDTQGLTPFAGVTRKMMIAYRDWMKEQARDGRGYANATIRRHFSCVKQFYAHALVEGLVARNPVELVKTYRVSDLSPRMPLSNAQANALLAHPNRATVKGALDYAILTVLLYMGLRNFEVAALSCDDVQQEREYLVLRIAHGKGDKPAELPVPPHVLEALSAYLALDGREGALSVRHEPLFHPTRNRHGDQSLDKHLTTNAIRLIVKGHARAVGIERTDVHSLRHTAATAAIEAGADLTTLQDMLRHSDIKTTRRYVKRREGLKDSAVWRVHY